MEIGNTRRGFTLLELAVTVIIIAVLAMVALPMYKHAVLKSRFSTVMPVAKAVADAQEVYYLGNNQYALGKEELDIAPVQAENTQVSLNTAEEEDKYIYVAANRSDIPGARYIMYQKNSPKFAGNIHCEAKADNDEALWLCEKGLQGTELTGEGASSIQGDNYKTFILAGTNGAGDYFAKTCSGSAEKTCPCGGPVTGTCNEGTGNWEYASDCPTQPTDTTEACDGGRTGNMTYTWQCNTEGTAWTKKVVSSTCEAVTYDGGGQGDFVCTSTDSISCAYGYTFTNRGDCSGSSSLGCNNNTYLNGSRCFGSSEDSCNGGTYEGKYRIKGGYSFAVCVGNKSNTCSNATFNADSWCSGYTSGSCLNGNFNSGSHCIATVSNTCTGTYNGTAYCEGNYCPAGTPANTAHTQCWDGNGNQEACS